MANFLDWKMESLKEKFSEELLLGTAFVRVNPDDKRIALRKDCSGCMSNYYYAKKHNKMVIYNLYTEDIVGVSMESNTKTKNKKSD